MDINFQHNVFDNYLIRTPILSTNDVAQLTVERIKSLCKIPFISEAIYIASPELHGEMIKFINDNPVRDEQKIVFALLKYLLRMGNRATPFGLFSGCAVGQLDTFSEIELGDPASHQRSTRLDMNYLCALSQKLEKDPDIRSGLKFYPNTSLYKVGDKLRYIEFRYEKTLRRHFTVAIDDSEYVSLILKRSKEGATIEELANLIEEPDVSNEEALQFIHELIDNQILVSSISPYVTGGDYFQYLKGNIESIKKEATFFELESILNAINNSPIGDGFSYYEDFYEKVKKFNVEFNKKFLLQTDLTTNYQKNTIDRTLIPKIDNALRVLNRFSTYRQNETLAKFKKDFYEKYEDEEISLCIALDVEAGVGYAVSENGSYDISPLIDDISLSGTAKGNNYSELKWTRKDVLLNGKMLEMIKNQTQEIIINDDDIKDLPENWNIIPDTFSVFISFLDNNKGNPKILLDSAGNVTASALLGRFCHSDKNVKLLVKKITDSEESLTNNIYAEIVHLPEKRTGNVLFRPHLRNYEIPYLAQSTLPEDNQIPIDDIMISIQSNNIVLRSKKLNKRIIPRLATAHNFSGNSLPIYNFLGDLQSQGVNPYLTFDWGSLAMLYSFFPRITYKGIIISRAQWVVNSKDLKKIKTKTDVQALLAEYKIPLKVLLVDDDNQLLIDFEHDLSIEMFISSIKNKSDISLMEFLLDTEDPLVKHKKDAFCHEIILSYHRVKN